MRHTVTIHKKDGSQAVVVENGANLLELLRYNSIPLDTPCGGKGTCGKCAVKVTGIQGEPSDKEQVLLGAARITGGYRLACRSIITGDLDVYPEEAARDASIITGGLKRDIRLAPSVTKQYVELAAPTLEDQLSDLERVLSVSEPELTSYDIALLQELPIVLRKAGFQVTLAGINEKLIAVEPGDTTDKLFGAAFDIGTTTVAAYLHDLTTGKCLAVASLLNPQRKYGADVISRISHAMLSKKEAKMLQSLIISCINDLLDNLVQKSGIKHAGIYMAVFAGNTTMMHLMMGLDASNIATAPFIPVTTGLQHFDPRSMDLHMNKSGLGVVLPGVSAYVGADTVAAILSSGMYEDEEISLLVDIGTNGEIVLGCREWMMSCSTAAGPAFEGANIRNGVGGVKGAIDNVGKAPDFQYTTIGDESPVGICGSGIIDLAAALLDAGVIDETGRLADKDETSLPVEEYERRIVSVEGIRAFRLAAEGEKGASEQIIITQRDIRELQNAKAAIAAGIETLVKLSGVGAEAVKKVYLAGGFGSSINIGSALKIGLLPRGFENRIQAIGNASGVGAVEGLLSWQMLELTGQIKLKVKYVELSASADFTERYVENMLFLIE
jgi:uncharacterized 2Fe-2S/4Fe-4S cluster protein (DUF4445 family)